jgi:hypothetical protein
MRICTQRLFVPFNGNRVIAWSALGCQREQLATGRRASR